MDADKLFIEYVSETGKAKYEKGPLGLILIGGEAFFEERINHTLDGSREFLWMSVIKIKSM